MRWAFQSKGSSPMDEFLTIADLVEGLKVKRMWIYEHTRRGSIDPLPCYKFGKHLRFKKDEIERWFELHKK